MRNQAYMRNYESTLIGLAEKGHQVNIRFNDRKDNDRLVEKLAQDYPQITYSYELLPKRRDIWAPLIELVRSLKDYLRYLSPEYAHAKKLKKRVEEAIGILRFVLIPFLKILYEPPNRQRRKTVDRTLDIIENIIVPADRRISKLIASQNPDIILITPLVDFDSIQRDYVKAAKSLGIKCGLCVHSWDNLTNKGTIHIHPDRIFVWNEIQRQEAVKFHGISADKIQITGAQCYDKWFERKPTTSQLEFNQKVGLSVNNSYLLYVCSSSFIAPQEVSFVKELLQQLRNYDHPQLKQVGLLVRPHPQNFQQWQKADFSKEEKAVIWPRGGQNPVTDLAKSNFYDSIYHSVAVIGINTSAMIEAGILGKPVYSILDPRFQDTQEGTLHFHHLVRGSLLTLSDSLTEFCQQLIQILTRNRENYEKQIQQFIHEFVRPYGLDTPCTPILVKSIEAMEQMPPTEIKPPPKWGIWVRVLLSPLAVILSILTYIYRRIKGAIYKLIIKPFF